MRRFGSGAGFGQHMPIESGVAVRNQARNGIKGCEVVIAIDASEVLRFMEAVDSEGNVGHQ